MKIQVDFTDTEYSVRIRDQLSAPVVIGNGSAHFHIVAARHQVVFFIQINKEPIRNLQASAAVLVLDEEPAAAHLFQVGINCHSRANILVDVG